MKYLIRFFDILFSLLALIVLSPLLFPVLVVLKLTGEGEVFYFQSRIGKNGKEFQIFKFATMLKDSANIGTGTVTVKNDSRVLPIGHFLRKTKINELPQLLNILLGDMSVIGPRPRTKKFFEALSSEERQIVSSVRPGLSGIGSIIFRNEDEILQNVDNPVDFDLFVITPYKGKVEKWFVNKLSIFLYFKLIIVTVIAIVRPKIDLNFYFKDLPIPPRELKNLLNGES